MKLKELIEKLNQYDENLYVNIGYTNYCADDGNTEQTEDIDNIKLEGGCVILNGDSW